MNINHNIKNLELFYNDSKKIINEIVLVNIDQKILKNINDAINILDKNWHGQDATANINKVIDIKNMTIDIRNTIGDIAVFISTVARKYCDIQISNAAEKVSFSEIHYDRLNKSEKETSNTQEVYLNPDVLQATAFLNSSSDYLQELNEQVLKIKNSIFDNWVQGAEDRSSASEMLENALTSINYLIGYIYDVNESINKSLYNYNLLSSKTNNAPGTGIIMNNATKEYSEDEKIILKNIKYNFENNRKITEEFSSKVMESIKKDLFSEGVLK